MHLTLLFILHSSTIDLSITAEALHWVPFFEPLDSNSTANGFSLINQSFPRPNFLSGRLATILLFSLTQFMKVDQACSSHSISRDDNHAVESYVRCSEVSFTPLELTVEHKIA